MEPCPVCGIEYSDFRTGLNYKEVYSLLWTDDDDPSTWKYKRRHTVLGKWHQIKLELWDEHVRYCLMQEEAEEACL